MGERLAEGERLMNHLHVIPVDPALTPQEAWDELCLMGVRATFTGEPTWATIRCDGFECDGIARDREPFQSGGKPEGVPDGQ